MVVDNKILLPQAIYALSNPCTGDGKDRHRSGKSSVILDVPVYLIGLASRSFINAKGAFVTATTGLMDQRPPPSTGELVQSVCSLSDKEVACLTICRLGRHMIISSSLILHSLS